MKQAEKQAEVDALILATKAMRFTAPEGVKYIRDHGHLITEDNYQARAHKLGEDRIARMHTICRDFQLLHMERIDTLRQVERELWKIYNEPKKLVRKEKDLASGYDETGSRKYHDRSKLRLLDAPLEPDEKVRILKAITDLQPWISSYEESTKKIMEREVKKHATAAIRVSDPGV